MAMTFGGNPTPSDVARATQPNTFTQNQTLEGTNNVAPNQTVASSSSLMTRDLVDARVFQPPAGPRYFAFNTSAQTSNHTANSGLARTANIGYEAISSTAANSVGTLRLAGAAAIFSSSWQSVDWNNPYVFGARVNVSSDGSLNANHTQHLLWGTSSYQSGQPSVRCVGFRINGTTIFAVCNDGTNYAEPGSLNSSVTNHAPMNLWVTTNGTGGASWYVNSTLVASTTTAAPFTPSATFQNEIVISSQSSGATSFSVRFMSQFFWIYKP